MNRTIRTIIGVFLILVIAFAAISIFQNLGRSWKADITEEKIYTLSDGTKNILARLKQPVTMKLFYAKTAALKGPDQIRYFNNYYHFVKDLLEEYESTANGMINLEIIDPRPFSEDEAQAMSYGLKRFRVTEEENFFFGLVLQTQFGVDKVIPFFAPDRQNFVEYDISYLVDSAITRQKKTLGVLSSMAVTGDQVSGYMAQMMRMQGKNPKPAWGIIEQLKDKYTIKDIPQDIEQITGVDVLLVIHPKDFSQKTLFAIDQYVLKGGRTAVFVDPFCMSDQPDQRAMQMGQQHSPSSDLNVLMRNWGLEMPSGQFAGDDLLALKAPLSQRGMPQKIIGFLGLNEQCFNKESVVTAQLNEVRILFSGVLNEVEISDPDINIERMPLIKTTEKGNSWRANPYELMRPNPGVLMSRFYQGKEPVKMGYIVTGKFKSSFPDGVEVAVAQDNQGQDGQQQPTKTLTGIKQAKEQCAVAVFSDVDFITDMVAYQDSFFGKTVVGDNSALLQNLIEDLSGSSDLISIRSRGYFKRPFTLIDKIEAQAENETRKEEEKIQREINAFQQELQKLVTKAIDNGQTIIDNSILQKRNETELKIRELQRQQNEIKLKRREKIDHLGTVLMNINMLAAPAVILGIAIVLGSWRGLRKRNYIGHSRDS